MTREFELLCLKYLTSDKDAEDLLAIIKPSIFKSSEYNIYAQLLTSYYSKYGTRPANVETLIQYLHEASKTSNIPADLIGVLEGTIRTIHNPYPIDSPFTRELLITNNRQALIVDLNTEYIGKLDNRTNQDAYRISMEDIYSLEDVSNTADSDRWGVPLFENYTGDKPIVEEGIPCTFETLNTWTSIGGFIKPELIVWMSGPKSFKTGFMINLADHLTVMGYKGYYVDTENGRKAIESRIFQKRLSLTDKELMKIPSNIILNSVKISRGMRGDLVVDHYPKSSCTTIDVRKRLKYLKKEFNFSPEFIIWDYPDNLIATKKHMANNITTNTQGVYGDIMALQSDIGVFGHAPSQINRAALSKKIFTAGDIATDFSKIFNCHACYAICATDLEIESNTARIHIVAQRRGLRASQELFFPVEIQYGIQSVKEINYEAAGRILDLKRKALTVAGYSFDAYNRLMFEGSYVYDNDFSKYYPNHINQK